MWSEKLSSSQDSVSFSASLSDNLADQVVATFPKATIGAAFIEYSFRETGTAKYKSGSFYILSDGGSAVDFEDVPPLLISDPGVTLTADISGANIRFLATTTSTGNARTGAYRVRTLAKL